MAQQLASEHGQSIWSVKEEALAAIRSETTNDVTRVRTVSLASVPQRIASEVAATLRLIQNLDRPD
jgi:4-hydroxy-3-methylbut-2-enyl diphosphate reductase IspH